MAWVEHHGTSWRVRHRHADGRIITDSTHPGRDSAVIRAKQLDIARALNTPPHAPGAGPTLAEWVTLWEPAHIAGPATWANYHSHLRNHILPRFGNTPIDAITRLAVKTFIKDLKTRYAQHSVCSIIHLLGLLLREAVDDRRIPVDVCQRLRVITDPIPERPWATPAQIRTIAARAPRLVDQVLIITAAYTGMRWGELTGLTRAHTHLGQGLLRIDPSTGSLHEIHGQLWLGPPKTPDSAREVTLPPFLTILISEVLDHHHAPTVFCAPRGGFQRRSNFARRTWHPATKGDPGHGIPPVIPELHFHDLRHTHKTWMIEDDIPEIAQAKRMGHHLPGPRGLYSHTTPGIQYRLLAALQRRWEASLPTAANQQE